MIRHRLAPAATMLIAASLLPVRPAGSAAPVTRAEALGSAAGYVAARQARSGAFFSESAPPDAVAEAIASLVAASHTASSSAIRRALSYVEREAPERARTPAYAGRVAMGAVAAGRDPRRFGGVDYVARIESAYNPATGAYESGLYADALAILGLVAARRPVPPGAITYLKANQCVDGGFGHDPGCVSRADADTTAVVLCAMAGARVGPGDEARARARSWLLGAQNDDGGFPLYPGDPTNANSTGMAASAAACLGQQDDAPPWRRANGAGPAAALLSLRTESGGIRFRAGDRGPNDYATVQALPGLAGAAYPIVSGASRVRPPAVSARASDPPPAGGGAAGSPLPLPSATPCPSPVPYGGSVERVRRAGVVIEFGDGSVHASCVTFTAAEERAGFTGVDLLMRSGLPVSFGGTRTAASVCRIGRDGCDGDGASCFCECRDATSPACKFWGYYRLGAGMWTFSDVGAAVRTIRDGDVDGWRYANHGDGRAAPRRSTRPCDDGGVRAPAASSRLRPGSGAAGVGLAAAAIAVFTAGAFVTVRRRRAMPDGEAP